MTPGSARSRSGRRCACGLLLAGLLAGAGCASEPTRDRGCGVDPEDRPFGRRIGPFVADVIAVPREVGADWDERTDLLAEWGRGFIARRGEELARTSSLVASLGSAVADDVRERGAALGDTSGGAVARAAADTNCFLARAWHALKLIE